MNLKIKRNVWDFWKEPDNPADQRWCVQWPKGIIGYKRKRDAREIAEGMKASEATGGIEPSL